MKHHHSPDKIENRNREGDESRMRLFPPPLKIDDEEGFSKDKDIFGRAQIGTGLKNLISSISDPMVLAVDGQWGSGKTIFLKMWAGELRKDGFPVVYFDAFENDYAEDAFTAFAGEIIGLAKKKKKEQTPQAKKFLKSAVGAGKVLLRSGTGLAIKAATGGLLEGTNLENIADDVGDELDGMLSRLLDAHGENKVLLEEFRPALRDLPSVLSPPAKSGDAKDFQKPLIFIVDELDRCRPTFALQILKRMKHFFSVPNVHFVLGVHLGQLRNSVIAAYGSGIDSRLYLQKFINLTVHLIDSMDRHHGNTEDKFFELSRPGDGHC